MTLAGISFSTQPLTAGDIGIILGALGLTFSGIGAGFALVIREWKRLPGDAVGKPPTDNSDLLGAIADLRGQVADASTKATEASTKADAAVAVGARTTDRVINLAAAIPPMSKPPIPIAPGTTVKKTVDTVSTETVTKP